MLLGAGAAAIIVLVLVICTMRRRATQREKEGNLSSQALKNLVAPESASAAKVDKMDKMERLEANAPSSASGAAAIPKIQAVKAQNQASRMNRLPSAIPLPSFRKWAAQLSARPAHKPDPPALAANRQADPGSDGPVAPRGGAPAAPLGGVPPAPATPAPSAASALVREYWERVSAAHCLPELEKAAQEALAARQELRREVLNWRLAGGDAEAAVGDLRAEVAQLAFEIELENADTGEEAAEAAASRQAVLQTEKREGVSRLSRLREESGAEGTQLEREMAELELLMEDLEMSCRLEAQLVVSWQVDDVGEMETKLTSAQRARVDWEHDKADRETTKAVAQLDAARAAKAEWEAGRTAREEAEDQLRDDLAALKRARAAAKKAAKSKAAAQPAQPAYAGTPTACTQPAKQPAKKPVSAATAAKRRALQMQKLKASAVAM